MMNDDSINDDNTIVRGSQNLFADLGYADAETHLLKAELVTRIRDIISESKLTQVDAAKRMGLSQPDVSRLLRGQFRDVSVERLMRMLTKLGCDVDIVVRDHARPSSERDTIHLAAQLPA
jgi:predicted XRE-type DNA-binding protein